MKNNHFTILIPAYNCEKWITRNLKSALQQDYENYEVIYINDASTDNTAEVLKDIEKSIDSASCTLKTVHNKVNRRALANLYDGVNMAEDGSIIVALDGDDWLANRYVLQTLNEIYQDDGVWITAGSYIENVGGRVVRPVITDDYWSGNIRLKPWTFSHLRTFRKELFQEIRRSDMIDVDGDFYKFTWDRVIMYPMIEMAGQKHFSDVQKIQYVYNRTNPISVDRVHRKDQLRIEADLKSKTPYPRLRELRRIEQ